jgi:site-specific recombinase XerD
MNDFIGWYCSEPRPAFSKHVVLRYRLDLESRNLSASTINLRLAAVRRLAIAAADSDLLSPELAAGIQRVKGAKKVGIRLGNWLTGEQCKALLQAPDTSALKGRRDKAVIAILIGCGLRRAEVAKLQLRRARRFPGLFRGLCACGESSPGVVPKNVIREYRKLLLSWLVTRQPLL